MSPNFNVSPHINCMRFGWLSLHYVVDIKCMSLQTIICIHIHICVTQLPTSAAQIEQLGRLISIDIPVSMAGNAKHVLLVICWTLYVRQIFGCTHQNEAHQQHHHHHRCSSSSSSSESSHHHYLLDGAVSGDAWSLHFIWKVLNNNFLLNVILWEEY